MAYVEKFKHALSLRLVACVAFFSEFQNKQDQNKLKNKIRDLIYRLNQCQISDMQNKKV